MVKMTLTFFLGVIFLWLLQSCNGYRDVLVQLNSKKVQHLVSERFLSISIDLKDLVSAFPLGFATLNMAKALYPMFIRLGGPSTDQLHFEADTDLSANTTITGEQWKDCHEFSQKAGADIIISLNAMTRVQRVWDSKNALDIVSFSNQNELETAFQLGHCISSLDGVSGTELGRDIVRFRMILNAFPLYDRAPVLSPDFTPSPKWARFIREFLNEASSVIAALPIEMTPIEIDVEDNLPAKGITDMNGLIWNSLQRTGKQIKKKPLWIAESEVGRDDIDDALSWIRRLGLAAKSGYQVVLRQPSSFLKGIPSPDIWASLLFKALVGREVLDVYITSGNKSMVHVFAHCTAPSTHTSVLDTRWKYERGSVTMYGVNPFSDFMKLSPRIGMKEELMHSYILTQDPLTNEMRFNGELLDLSPSLDLPFLSPRVRRPSRFITVNLPPRSIFFFVFPEARARTCSVNPLLNVAQEIASRLTLGEDLPLASPIGFGSKSRAFEADYDDSNTQYVKYGKEKKKQDSFLNEDEYPVRYVTFNDDPWMGRFAEIVKPENQETKNENNFFQQPPSEIELINKTSDPTGKNKRSKRAENIERIYQLSEKSISETLKAALKEALSEVKGKFVEEEVKRRATIDEKSGRESKEKVFDSGVSNVRKDEQLEEKLNIVKSIKEEEEVKEELEKLTEGGEKLVHTIDTVGAIDMVGNSSQNVDNKIGINRPSKTSNEGFDKNMKTSSAKEFNPSISDQQKEKIVSQVNEDGKEGNKIITALDKVMAEVNKKVTPTESMGNGKNLLRSLVEENISKGSAFEVGTEDDALDDKYRGTRDQDADLSTPEKPKITSPLDLKVLTAENVQQTLEEFREKLKSSREKLRSMAGLPTLESLSKSSVPLNAPLMDAKAEFEKLLSRKVERAKRNTKDQDFQLDETSTIPDSTSSQAISPNYDHETQKVLEDFFEPIYDEVDTDSRFFGRQNPRKQVAHNMIIYDNNFDKVRESENKDNCVPKMKEDFEIQNKVAQSKLYSSFPYDPAIEMNQREDWLKNTVLKDNRAKTLFALAKRFTQLDLLNQGIKKEESAFENVQQVKEANKNEEKLYDDEADWMADAVRITNPSLLTSEDKVEEKESYILKPIIDKVKSIVGFFVQLIDKIQQKRTSSTSV